MPKPWIFVTSLLVASPALAQQPAQSTVPATAPLPAGWSAREDRDRPLDDAKFATMGAGLHATMGRRAAVFYRDADNASGSYTMEATFTQTKAPEHPEAFGVFIGGRDLQGANQQYTYFLIRGDGKYLIKRRNGATTSNVQDWTANEAVKAQDAAGKCTNTLTVQVAGGDVIFKVNGADVHRAKAADVDAEGISGLRVNHNLDVHIAGFRMQKAGM